MNEVYSCPPEEAHIKSKQTRLHSNPPLAWQFLKDKKSLLNRNEPT